MSHFTTIVIIPNGSENIEEAVTEALAPFQENNMGDCPTEYLEFNDVEEEYRKEADDIITADDWTGQNHPDAVGKTKLEYYGKGDFDTYVKEWAAYERDKQTGKIGYWENPNAKWDWWEIGGRWYGRMTESGENISPVSDIQESFTPFSIVTPDGEWIEKGDMGWWAVVLNAKDDDAWKQEAKNIFEKFKDCTAVLVDCHI